MLRYFFVVMVTLVSLGITMVDGPDSSQASEFEADTSMMITFNGGIPPFERCMPYPQCAEENKDNNSSSGGSGGE
ncbi:MAG TPA: hypothetical protein VLU25_14860 [Acidobacteriota bacterium]|nr:hypothetical protein [Acidobacteriota bacterium]